MWSKEHFKRTFIYYYEKYFLIYILPSKQFLKWKFKRLVGYELNLKEPKTFCEKLQWLKFESKKHPEYSIMVDKVAAKDYVASIVGDKYIIPTLGVWNSVDDISWETLPNKFVIKSSNDSGGVIVCKDKTTLDIGIAMSKLRNNGERDYTKYSMEYPYRNVPHRYIAEVLLDNGKDIDLPDYKFFCFNGEPKYCQVIRERCTEETIDFYDMKWEHQDFVGLNPKAGNGLTSVPCPRRLEEMKDVCRKLSKNHPFLRVDLYVVDDELYFGELTFFPASGMGVFSPSEWDRKFGDMIKLPIDKSI